MWILSIFKMSNLLTIKAQPKRSKQWRIWTLHQSDDVSVWRWGQVRLNSGGTRGVLKCHFGPTHTFTPSTPVLYVACLFTNHIMQKWSQLNVSMNASFPDFCYSRVLLYGFVWKLLALPLRVAYSDLWNAPHLFHYDDLNWLLNLLCYWLYFALFPLLTYLTL